MNLLIATTNPSKIEEIRAILAGLPIELQTLASYPGIREPEETGTAFADNARQKALHYAAAAHELTVAEDSGLGDRRPRWRAGRSLSPLQRRDVRGEVSAYLRPAPPARRGGKLGSVRVRAGSRGPWPDHLRDAPDGRRRPCSVAPGPRRLRLRPDLLLSAVRPHPRRGVSRREGGGEPSRPGLSGTAGIPGRVGAVTLALIGGDRFCPGSPHAAGERAL